MFLIVGGSTMIRNLFRYFFHSYIVYAVILSFKGKICSSTEQTYLNVVINDNTSIPKEFRNQLYTFWLFFLQLSVEWRKLKGHCHDKAHVRS